MAVAIVVLIVVVFDLYCASEARAWTRQAPWYVPCAQVVCVLCREFAVCVCV